jgi:hypothetical protein
MFLLYAPARLNYKTGREPAGTLNLSECRRAGEHGWVALGGGVTAGAQDPRAIRYRRNSGSLNSDGNSAKFQKI